MAASWHREENLGIGKVILHEQKEGEIRWATVCQYVKAGDEHGDTPGMGKGAMLTSCTTCPAGSSCGRGAG
jgi:hypothetical protein